MPKILQINVTANWGSTGRITEECNIFAAKQGWECYAAFGRYSNPSHFSVFKIGSKYDVYEHYAENQLLDNEGLASHSATRKLVEKIKEIQPDIVHLHNIHDHWLNYRILFEYLNQTDIKVVWTFHDFWAVTGHCTHFVQAQCEQFKTECVDCPYTKGHLLPLFKRTKRNFNLKKELFCANKSLTIVTVSEWVGENVRQSFLKDKKIIVIPNGVDADVFKPTEITTIPNLSKLFQTLQNKFVIMAVSSQWKSGSKGLDDYKAMSRMLADDEVIVLVGVDDKIIAELPSNIIGIKRTNNQQELAALYTRAEVVCSFSAAETFGLTIVEGYACGTPAVVFDNTAPPTLVVSEGFRVSDGLKESTTGFVVPDKDYKAAYQAIQKIKAKGRSHYSEACRKIAVEKYNKDKCFEEYVKLYEALIEKK